MLILALAIIAIAFGTYFTARYRNALETKKQAEQQKQQIEKQVNDQLEQFESKLEGLEGQIPENGN